MSGMYEGIVQDLIDELAKLPGVGPKGASRIAFYLLHADHGEIERLAQVLSEVRDKARFCAECFNVSEDDVCRICSDTRRDQSKLCVVEDPKDVLAIERTREFRGLYHVLGGAINPMDGIGPDSLNIAQLIARLADNSIQEVILATNPNMEGEATATYISRQLAPLGVEVTRLASGLPVGGDLEYADDATLRRAFAGRRQVGSQQPNS